MLKYYVFCKSYYKPERSLNGLLHCGALFLSGIGVSMAGKVL